MLHLFLKKGSLSCRVSENMLTFLMRCHEKSGGLSGGLVLYFLIPSLLLYCAMMRLLIEVTRRMFRQLSAVYMRVVVLQTHHPYCLWLSPLVQFLSSPNPKTLPIPKLKNLFSLSFADKAKYADCSHLKPLIHSNTFSPSSF